jgi:hypothetical protein
VLKPLRGFLEWNAGGIEGRVPLVIYPTNLLADWTSGESRLRIQVVDDVSNWSARLTALGFNQEPAEAQLESQSDSPAAGRPPRTLTLVAPGLRADDTLRQRVKALTESGADVLWLRSGALLPNCQIFPQSRGTLVVAEVRLLDSVETDPEAQLRFARLLALCSRHQALMLPQDPL